MTRSPNGRAQWGAANPSRDRKQAAGQIRPPRGFGHRLLAIVAMSVAAGNAVGFATAGDEEPKTDPALHPRVKMETSLGDIVLELDAEKAPLTVVNFAQYVKDGFYDGTVFHRVLKEGLIQGGAYTRDMEKKTAGLGDGVKNESDNGLRNLRGTIAMYRIPGFPDSAVAEFFINVGTNSGLDLKGRDGAAYTVFGQVVEGMETVDKISQTLVGTHPGFAAGRSEVVPLQPVVIKSVELLGRFDHQKALARAEAIELEKKRAVEAAKKAAEEEYRKRLEAIEEEVGAKFVTTDSGLKYIDVRVGNGAPPIPEEKVMVRYRGTLIDGTEFDNTDEHEEPKIRQVSKFIPGLRDALLTMFEGGERILVIPPELGFGDHGVPGRIPPNATLIFELELLSIE